MNEDWTKNQKKEGSAVGGPYLAMHLRRADFLYAHADKVPSLDAVVSQVKDLLEKHKLQKVFLATDGEQDGEEFSWQSFSWSPLLLSFCPRTGLVMYMGSPLQPNSSLCD